MAIDPKYDITQPLDDPQDYSGMSSNVLFGNEMRNRPNNSMMMSRQGGILGGGSNVGMLGAENAAAQAKRIFDERQMRDRESIERLRANIGRTEQFLADTPPPRAYTRADALIDRLRAFGTGRGGSKTRRVFDSLNRGRQMAQENALLRRQQVSDYLGSQSQLMEGYNQLSGLENQVGQDQIVANWIDTLPDAQLRALYYGNPELARDEFIKSKTSTTLADSVQILTGRQIKNLPLSDRAKLGFGDETTLVTLGDTDTFRIKMKGGIATNVEPFNQNTNTTSKLFTPTEIDSMSDKEKQSYGFPLDITNRMKKNGIIEVKINPNGSIKGYEEIEGKERQTYSSESILTKHQEDLSTLSNSMYNFSNYLNTLTQSKDGLTRLKNQILGVVKRVKGDPDLTGDEIMELTRNGELQQLLGTSRERIVGPGVMTEYDAQRILQALGGESWGSITTQIAQRNIRRLFEQDKRQYDRLRSTYNKLKYDGVEGFNNIYKEIPGFTAAPFFQNNAVFLEEQLKGERINKEEFIDLVKFYNPDKNPYDPNKYRTTQNEEIFELLREYSSQYR